MNPLRTKVSPCASLALAFLAHLWGLSDSGADESGPFRDFTNADGKRIRARILDKAEGQIRVLREKDRRVFTIDIDNLSDADRRYIKGWKLPGRTKQGGDLQDTLTESRWYPRGLERLKEDIEKIRTRDTSIPGFAQPELRALANLNAQRLLSEVPSDIVLTTEFSRVAKAGASLCKKLGRLEHTPSKPEDMSDEDFKIAYRGTSSSNLGVGSSLEISPLSFIYDRGRNNLAEQGHRRWCLNPAMAKTGFGADGRFTAMYTVDRSRSRTPDYLAIRCPGRGYIPLSMFQEKLLWSVSLNPVKYHQPIKTDLSVNVYRVKPLQSPDGRGARSAQVELDHLEVSAQQFGEGHCIMFRPKNYRVRHDSRYLVRIAGLKPRRLAPGTLEYIVHFKNLKD